jgi:hypothetical protein
MDTMRTNESSVYLLVTHLDQVMLVQARNTFNLRNASHSRVQCLSSRTVNPLMYTADKTHYEIQNGLVGSGSDG